MKSYKNLFGKICDPENIMLAIRNASKGKTRRTEVKIIRRKSKRYAMEISDLMKSGRIEFHEPKPRIISDGPARKKRVIVSPHFDNDQIVHHSILQVISPIFTKSMYEWCCASVPGRGIHYMKKHLEKFIRSDKPPRYIMKLDIHHFFNSIDHNILKKKLGKVIHDHRTMNLIDKIIDNFDDGLPLGYYTSQWFANFFLQELDHKIAQDECCVCYTRYMDDMVICGNNKKKLRVLLSKIKNWLGDNKLELKGNYQIFPLQYRDKYGKLHGRALDIGGFKFYCNRTTIRKRLLRRIKRKAKVVSNNYAKGHRNTWYEASQMVSYQSWLLHSNCKYLYRTIGKMVNFNRLKKTVSHYNKEKYYGTKIQKSNREHNTGKGQLHNQGNHCN